MIVSSVAPTEQLSSAVCYACLTARLEAVPFTFQMNKNENTVILRQLLCIRPVPKKYL